MRIRAVITLTALDGFRCIGADCPQSCCRNNWQIPVDDATLTAWAALPDVAERERLTVTIKTPDGETGGVRRLLRMNPNGECLHLTPEAWCGIQVRHGHNLLPETCRNYPRFHGESALRAVHSAALSCPEIARRALGATPDMPVWVASSPPREQDDAMEFWLSRELDACLAERRASVGARLYALGETLARLDQLAQHGRLDPEGLRRACRNPGERVRNAARSLAGGRLKPPALTAGSFWYALLSLGNRRGLLRDDDVASVPSYARLAAGSAETRDSHYAALHAELADLFQTAWVPQANDHAAGLERYLRAAFLNNGFPWKPLNGNYVLAFMVVMVLTGLVKLHVVLRRGAEGPAHGLVEAVYRVERFLSHNDWLSRQFANNPRLLRLQDYLGCLAELG